MHGSEIPGLRDDNVSLSVCQFACVAMFQRRNRLTQPELHARGHNVIHSTHGRYIFQFPLNSYEEWTTFWVLKQYIVNFDNET